MKINLFDKLMFLLLLLIGLCVYLHEQNRQQYVYVDSNLQSEEIALINKQWDDCTIIADVYYKSRIQNGKSYYDRNIRFIEVFNNKTKKQVQIPASQFSEEEFSNMQGRKCSLKVSNYDFKTKQYNLIINSIEFFKLEI
jgi:hypothetical protein